MNLTGTTGALLDAYNRHDVETVASLYTADGTHEDMAPNKSKVGAAAIAAGLSTFFGWFPDAHWTPRKLIDGRTASALTYLLEATLTTDMFGVKAHGQKIHLQGALILHFSGKLIRRSEDYWDAATFKRQVDAIREDI
ncbi:ester cyclase [Novosphingobium sp. ST904]|uniref:nuclear transport factor 2 family protein n=1 Tax=Novosphingobium sp. ST904 TaxID=1684385 RepID=UPI0006C87D67|nr:ester cyclase [Novosphingobium sp. ST904]KPH64065.1 hypothetical protein ADT71_12290 [Novosphingobium sp. ST904]TCM32449.1 steroid delta-isomerase-like uncharacterized protein [Novosphingobium sp. ST904]